MAALMASAANAQTTETAQKVEPSPATGESEIIVTATRRDQTLISVPIAVTAVTAEEIDAAQIRNTQDLARIAPGLVITTAASEATAAVIRLRGVGTSGNNLGLEGSVGVFVDGVYRARSGIALADLFDIAQVEILRGPQGTLFGKNTTAGALVIRTLAPSFDWNADAVASYGNFNALRLAAGVGGPLSDQVAFRIAGVYNQRDGYLNDVRTGLKVNDRDRWALRGQMLYKPTDQFSLRIIADYAKKNEACCGAPVVVNGSRAPIITALGGFVPTQFSDYTVANSGPFVANTEEWGISGQADAQFGAVTWTNIISYRDFKSFRNTDSDFASIDLLNTQNEVTLDRFFTAETTLKGSIGPVDWLFGGFYFNQQTRQTGALTYGRDLQAFFQRSFPASSALLVGRYPVGGGDTQRNFSQDAHGWSVFTHNIIEILPRLKATIGLRYLSETKNGNGRFAFNSPSCGVAGIPAGARQLCPVPNFDANFEDGKLIGTAVLSYAPTPTSLLYASFSRGYKAGGINLDRSTGAATGTGGTFLPEEVDSYELGAKARFLGGKVRTAVTLFSSKITNFQQNAFTGTAFIISNAAEVNSKGVEFELTLAPARGINLNTSLVYNDATFGPATVGATIVGRQIVNAPKWTVQSQLALEQPIGTGGWSLFSNANMRLLSDINTSVSLIPQAEQDGYILVGGRLGVRAPEGRWDVSLFAQNLTNQYYRTIVFAGVLQPGTFNAFVGEPRTFGVEARVRF